MSILFKDFDLQPEILEVLEEAGYIEPTPIQEKAIPILMQGTDLIGVAETGTGKTLAFLLPIFRHLDIGAPEPQALVICPTRELAVQVAKESARFGECLGIRTELAYGGTSSGGQKRALAGGCEIVVGTPGRLIDFLTSAWLSLRKLKFLVLDEADRMLDMGFINDIDTIIRKAPMSRQTMLFSATFPEQIRRLTEKYMYDPKMVAMHTGTRVASQVKHAFYPVRQDQKVQLLAEILKRDKPDKVLIFTATREGTSELALQLRRHRYEVISLSSLLSQANRERALDAFRSGDCPILVATDVAARGLDITDIDLVVNFDVPMQAEDYVHRIGRTGRAARFGKAITLVCELDSRMTGDIERLLQEKIPRLELEGFQYKPMGRPAPAGRRRNSPHANRGRNKRNSSRGRR
jgi:superfamily II DNA/RNA helicase